MCYLKSVLKKKLILLVISTYAFGSSYAQFDGQYSQYMNNLSLINPAYAGEQTMVQVSIFQRTQWIGMPGAPIVSMFSVDTPFKLFEKQHGVGIQFLSDIFGVFNNQQMRLLYAYKQKIKNGYFSFGTNIGLVNIICNGDSINISKISADDGYHSKNDPAIPTGKQTGIGFDLGLGMQFFGESYMAGLSLTHITAPTITLGEKSNFKILPLLQIHGAYDIKTRNPDYKVRTNLLVSTDFISWTSHISAILDIKERFWVGLGYRLEDSFSIMGGLKILDGLKIGYSFDLPTSKLIYKTFGSHEIFATYEFSLFKEKSKALKSIRIL